MPRPFQQLDQVDTPEGLLELRCRGGNDFMILVGGRVLMTSMLTTSEYALAENGCAAVAHIPRPRILIGGLGLGFTLQSVLSHSPPRAEIFVAELNAKVVDWCRGPVAAKNGGAVLDRRVKVILGDVTEEIRRVAEDPLEPRFDAILWDLYVGPTRKGGSRHPLYGEETIQHTQEALTVGGAFGVWSETPSPAFEERLRKHGFSPTLIRTGGAGLRHAVYLATKKPPKKPSLHKTRKKKAPLKKRPAGAARPKRR
jgi:spermidine synthase